MSEAKVLLEAAAMLQEAAKLDERLTSLATEATKLVLADEAALAALFSAYLHPPTPSPPPPYTEPPKQKPSQQDVSEATELLKKLAKELT